MADSTETERTRIAQSNDVASIVFDQVKKVWPDLHPVLDLRYGIADALWDAGYRKVEGGSGVDWTCAAHGDSCPKHGLDWDCA